MNFIKINQKGTAHKNGECEDAFYINKDNTVCCVADGVSNSRYGAIGARRVVSTLGKMFSSPKNKEFLKVSTVDNIRTEICSAVDNVLSELCEKYSVSDKEAFASTFLAIVETDENDITLIHGGDGAIFAKPKTEQTYFATVISYPDNSNDGRVFSIGNPEQVNRMRILRVKKEDYESIMLCTDGFSEAYLVPSFQAYNIDSITQAFMVKDDEELRILVHGEHICGRAISDDITCVLCKLNNVQHICRNDAYFDEHKIGKREVIKVTDEKIPETASKQTPINQIKYSESSKNPVKNSKKNPSLNNNRLVAVIAALIVCVSLFLGMWMLNTTKSVSAQDTEISALKEQIKVFEDRVNELEDMMTDNDLSETTSNTDQNSSGLTENTNNTNSSDLLTEEQFISEPLG